jgi:glycosyltransferase involved in cell wall biosynthesis
MTEPGTNGLPPLVSIVVPAYNAASTLADCLDSIARQTYGRIEVVVVDDGSTDSTRSVADDAAASDRRIRVIVQHNLGCPAACNAGLVLARGSWFVRLDADDVLMESYVADMMALASENPGYGAYASNGLFLGPDASRPIHRVRRHPVSVDAHGILRGRRLPGNALFSLDYLQLTGGFNPALRHDEDLDFWLRGALLGASFLFDYRPRWYYRREGRGKSEDTRAETAATLEILDAASLLASPGDPTLARDLDRAKRKAKGDCIRRDLERALLREGAVEGPRRRFVESYPAYEKPWAFWLALPVVMASPGLYARLIARRRFTTTYRA